MQKENIYQIINSFTCLENNWAGDEAKGYSEELIQKYETIIKQLKAEPYMAYPTFKGRLFIIYPLSDSLLCFLIADDFVEMYFMRKTMDRIHEIFHIDEKDQIRFINSYINIYLKEENYIPSSIDSNQFNQLEKNQLYSDYLIRKRIYNNWKNLDMPQGTIFKRS